MSDDGRLEEFNWRKTGPGDVARGAVRRVDEFVRENAPWVVGSIVILTMGTWHYQPTWPGVPPWLQVALVAAIPATPLGVYMGLRLAAALDSPETRLLSVQNPVTGDQKLVHLSPDRFESMTVLNHNGKERDRTYLHEVMINGRRAYEVDSYDREANTSVASWQAGISNSAIRKDRARIKEIRTSLEEEADKTLELLANHPHILREHAQTVSMRLIRAAEGIEVPEGEQLHDELSTILDENDPSEDLLEGEDAGSRASDGSSEAQSPDAEDIFARAAAAAADADPSTNGHEQGGGDGE